MKNKKALALVSSFVLVCGVAATIAGANILDLQTSAATEKGTCEYYFDESNGYKSLYELNKQRLDGGADLTSVKTWGTVTKTFYNNSSHSVAQQFIQSTDKNGNVGSTCLYGISSGQVYPEGSIVTVTGNMTLFNGMSEMKDFTVVPDKDVNPSPVEPLEINPLVFSLPTTSDNFKEYRYQGTRQVYLPNITFGEVKSSRECTATFSDKTNTALLFFNSVEKKNDIITKINTICNNNSSANVTGYLTIYDSNNSGTNPKFQVLIRDDADIVEVQKKTLSSISVTPNKTFYYGQDVTINDFVVTATFSDSSTQVVTSSATLVNPVDTSSLGSKSVSVSYTYNGTTKNASCNITVNDAINNIEIIDPITVYTRQETFVKPTVLGYLSSSYTTLSSGVTFSSFNNSSTGTYQMTASYNSVNNKTLTDSYSYTISDVYGIDYSSSVINYNLGDTFVKPVVLVSYDINPSSYVDVSDRCTVDSSSIDMNTEGDYTVYVSYGYTYFSYTIHVLDKHLQYISVVDPITSYSQGDTFVKPTVRAYYDDSSNEVVTNQCTFTGYNNTLIGEQTINVTYLTCNTSYTITMFPSGCYTENVASISGIGSYNTGNYGTSGDFGYYRAVTDSDNLIKLLPQKTYYEATLPGAIYNINAFRDIKALYITYQTSSSDAGSGLPYVTYGENGYSDHTINLNLASSQTSVLVNLSNYETNYFRICTGDYNLTINSFTIYYTGTYTSHLDSLEQKSANNGQYRITPTVYSGSLVDGVSYVDVPTSFSVSQNKVLSTKRYTYYSYQYASEHSSIASTLALVDPVDVVNYFHAFGCAPCNYGVSGDSFALRDGLTLPSSSEVRSLFGNNYARCISKYSRTNGYATAVPYYGTTPLYYELDIKTGASYTVSNRQVGRIVCFSTGLNKSSYGYGGQYVSFYTDDHYATFKEYNNFGGFMPRFTAQYNTLDYLWSEPTTLSGYTF